MPFGDVVLHEQVDPPLSFTRAREAARVVSLLTFAFYLWTCVALTVRSRELAATVQSAKSSGRRKRLVKWLRIHMLLNLLTQCDNQLWLYLEIAPGDAAGLIQCRIGNRLSATMYGMAMGANYMVLLIRAEATLDRKRWAEDTLFKLCKLATYLGVPLTSGMALVLFEGASMFSTGICAQNVELVVVYIFMAADTGLSAMLLLLFILPVRRLMQDLVKTSGSGGSGTASMFSEQVRAMRITSRRNLRLSAIQIGSTFVSQVAGCVYQAMFSDVHDPAYSWLRWLGLIGYIADIVCNSVALLCMTTAWLPSTWYVSRRIFMNSRNKVAVKPSQQQQRHAALSSGRHKSVETSGGSVGSGDGSILY